MNFRHPQDRQCLGEYRIWLDEHAGIETLDWKFNFWKFDMVYGVTIVDPEVELLFRLKFDI